MEVNGKHRNVMETRFRNMFQKIESLSLSGQCWKACLSLCCQFLPFAFDRWCMMAQTSSSLPCCLCGCRIPIAYDDLHALLGSIPLGSTPYYHLWIFLESLNLWNCQKCLKESERPKTNTYSFLTGGPTLLEVSGRGGLCNWLLLLWHDGRRQYCI